MVHTAMSGRKVWIVRLDQNEVVDLTKSHIDPKTRLPERARMIIQAVIERRQTWHPSQSAPSSQTLRDVRISSQQRS